MNPIATIEKCKKMLLISNTALGDTLLSTPTIKSLNKSFPNAYIVAVFKSSFSPLFEKYEYIDEIIEYNGKDEELLKTVKIIKEYNFDLALILHSNSPQDIELCVLSDIPYILKTPTNSKLKRFLSYDFMQKNQHTIETRLDLIRLIGAKNIDTKMSIGMLDDEILKRKFLKYENYIGFQIGAADKFKMWPVENFITLSKKLLGVRILITGMGSEWELAQKIVEKCPNVVNMCGVCSIKELPYLLNNLTFLVTNDTGTMHLAIALKIPTVSLFSPTSSQGMGAYQDLDMHKIIQKDGTFIQKFSKKKRDDSAMKLISVDEVYKVCLEMI